MQTSVDENDTTVEHTVHMQVTGMMCQKSCGKEGRGPVLVSVSIALFSPLQRSMISLLPHSLYGRECSEELTRMHSCGSVVSRQLCGRHLYWIYHLEATQRRD